MHEPLPIGEARIRERLREVGAEIVRGYAAGASADERIELTLVPILTGAFVVAADLLRALGAAADRDARRLSITTEFLRARSYRAGTDPGPLELDTSLLDPARIAGRHVLVVDDIVDSGRTLAAATRFLSGLGARSTRSFVLLDKPARRAPGTPVVADHVGFAIDDEFVVGYGLDHDGLFRHLPFVEALDLRNGMPRVAGEG